MAHRAVHRTEGPDSAGIRAEFTPAASAAPAFVSEIRRLMARRYFFRYPPASSSAVKSPSAAMPEASTGIERS